MGAWSSYSFDTGPGCGPRFPFGIPDRFGPTGGLGSSCAFCQRQYCQQKPQKFRQSAIDNHSKQGLIFDIGTVTKLEGRKKNTGEDCARDKRNNGNSVGNYFGNLDPYL